jgi:hypothetical protein
VLPEDPLAPLEPPLDDPPDETAPDEVADPELLADDPAPPPELPPDALLPLAAAPEPPPLLEALLLEDAEASPVPPTDVELHPAVARSRCSNPRRPTVRIALMVCSSGGTLQAEGSPQAKARSWRRRHPVVPIVIQADVWSSI